MAVIGYRLFPAVNLRLEEGWARDLSAHLAVHPLLHLLPAVSYVVLLTIAMVLDQLRLYTVDRPRWLRVRAPHHMLFGDFDRFTPVT